MDDSIFFPRGIRPAAPAPIGPCPTESRFAQLLSASFRNMRARAVGNDNRREPQAA